MTDRLAISVVICTHNRAGYLSRALDGLARQSLPADRFEVIVVDNASHDETPAVVRERRFGELAPRYLHESRLGLSHARNRGWREAAAPFVAFLDDDAVPEPDWLLNAVDELQKQDPGLGLLGGRVSPIWEAPRPNWLSDRLVPYLSMIDLGTGRHLVNGPTGIVGANMIASQQALERVGGFSPALGRKGNSLLSNEELMFKQALADAGYHALYRGDIAVMHHVPAERLTRAWFLRRHYWQGRSDQMWRDLVDPRTPFERSKAAARALRRAARFGWRALTSRTAAARFDWAIDWAFEIGSARGALSPGRVRRGREE